MSDLLGRCGICGKELGTTAGFHACTATGAPLYGTYPPAYYAGRIAQLEAENSDLRALLMEARSHNPERYRSSSDDSGTRGAETGGELLPQPSSDWTRVAPSGEGSGQPTIREGWCPHCGTTRIEDYSDGVSDVCGHTSDANVVRLAFREGFNMSDGARAEHALTGKTITVDAAWAASEAKASLKGMGAEGAMSDMTLQAHDDGYEQGRLAAFGVIRKAAQTVIDQRKPRAFEPHDDGRRSFAFDVLELCDDALGARREP